MKYLTFFNIPDNANVTKENYNLLKIRVKIVKLFVKMYFRIKKLEILLFVFFILFYLQRFRFRVFVSKTFRSSGPQNYPLHQSLYYS